MAKRTDADAIITPEILALLLAHKKRTKVGVVKLLNYKVQHPNGLTQAMVTSWLNGKVKTARKEHLDYVLNKWKTFPTITSDFVYISDQALKDILLYKSHTGLGAGEFLSYTPNVPAGLKAATINNWFYGVRTTREDYLEFVLRNWRKLAEDGMDRIKLTPELMQKIRFYKKEGLLPSAIFKDADNIPTGLKSFTISSWLAGRTKTVKKVHIQFVLNRCEEMDLGKSPK